MYIYIYICICVYVYVYVCMYMYMYIYVYVYMYIYTYIYVCMYICMQYRYTQSDIVNRYNKYIYQYSYHDTQNLPLRKANSHELGEHVVNRIWRPLEANGTTKPTRRQPQSPPPTEESGVVSQVLSILNGTRVVFKVTPH